MRATQSIHCGDFIYSLRKYRDSNHRARLVSEFAGIDVKVTRSRTHVLTQVLEYSLTRLLTLALTLALSLTLTHSLSHFLSLTLSLSLFRDTNHRARLVSEFAGIDVKV